MSELQFVESQKLDEAAVSAPNEPEWLFDQSVPEGERERLSTDIALHGVKRKHACSIPIALHMNIWPVVSRKNRSQFCDGARSGWKTRSISVSRFRVISSENSCQFAKSSPAPCLSSPLAETWRGARARRSLLPSTARSRHPDKPLFEQASSCHP